MATLFFKTCHFRDRAEHGPRFRYTAGFDVLRAEMKNLIFIVLTLWMDFAFADGFFWVLGSYADEEVAMTEGRRINTDTGVEILMQETNVNGARYYRLLTGINEDGDEVAISDMRRYMGLGNAVTTNVVQAVVRRLYR